MDGPDSFSQEFFVPLNLCPFVLNLAPTEISVVPVLQRISIGCARVLAGKPVAKDLPAGTRAHRPANRYKKEFFGDC